MTVEDTNWVISINDLLEKNLAIPEYQRPYTWSEKHLIKMLDDFNDFFISDYKESGYYLGAILLHKDNDTYNIVDGQQRITTILLLMNLLNIDMAEADMSYTNPQSQNQIKINYQTLNLLIGDSKRFKQDDIKAVISQIKLTVIETENVDDAFTFFDTQNNRGVQPSVLVLLKAFNLRCIEKKERQVYCAKQWEKHEKNQTEKLDYIMEKSEKLEWIIQVFFYRVRNWKGSSNNNFGCYEDIRDDFTKGLRVSKNNYYKKYPSFTSSIALTQNTQLISTSINENWFDFAIRQPIYQGEGFFEFVSYYGDLLDNLMEIEIFEGKPFKDLVKVHKQGSRFTASFLTIVVAIYFDRFKQIGLADFVKLLDTLLANIRLKQSRILKQTMNKQFVRCENAHIKQNILDFLTSAFDEEEVWQWINHNQKVEKSTNDSLKGVRKRFLVEYKKFWGVQDE